MQRENHVSNQKQHSIQSVFVHMGCTVTQLEHTKGSGVDFIVEIQGDRYAAMVKTLTSPRTEDVIGRFSTMILQSQRTHWPPETMPLLTVAVPRWGTPMADRIRSHMQEHAPHFTWALLDHVRGAIHLEPSTAGGESQPLVWYSEAPLTTSRVKRNANLFTDLNMWLLKVLLYKDAPEPYRIDISSRIENPNHLSTLADVSRRTAYSFFKTFESMDFLRNTKNKGIHVVRRPALLEMWIQEATRTSPVKLHCCSSFGELDSWEDLLQRAGDMSFALGGFGACRMHGVLHTNASPIWDVHIKGDILTFESLWNLQACGENEAQINFIESTRTGAIFRCINRRQALPMVDLIQSALDVAPLPGRGREQAEHIAELVNRWE